MTNREISSFGTLGLQVSIHNPRDRRAVNEPRVDPSHLSRSLVATTMLTLLVCFCKDLEQLFPDRHWLSFVTDLPQALNNVSPVPLGKTKHSRLVPFGQPVEA